MRKDYIEAGKAVGTHGIRGMVRIQPWSDDADFLADFKTVYVGEAKKPLEITKLQPHGRIAIASFRGIDTIEAAEQLRNNILYIKRDDAHLPEGRVFVDELIGCDVYDADTDECLGKITDVSETGANDVWHITNDRGEFLIPAIDSVVINIDIDSECVKIRPIKGIFDNEN